ncbi:MAG TPA: virulence factor [Paracoccaceae bacterium]|nr:virulence factor [Paracoccaceae bacterium]
MTEVTIVFWRDIPAQVIVGKGRKAAKVQLSERFEKAIDMAAMRSGAAETDDYLQEWRKSAIISAFGAGADVAPSPKDVADSEAARLETEYGQDRLKELIARGGREA